MTRQIKNRPGYSKRRTRDVRGHQVFRWMRNQIPTWQNIRGPVAGPPSARASRTSMLKSRQPKDTPESRAHTARAAAHDAATEALRRAALSDPRFTGLDASDVHVGDLAKLEAETADHLSRAEVRFRIAREVLARPELAELASGAGLDVLEYGFRQGGIHFALARLGHGSAYAHIDEPERTAVIAEARAYGRLAPNFDPYGGVRLYPAEDYDRDPALLAASRA